MRNRRLVSAVLGLVAASAVVGCASHGGMSNGSSSEVRQISVAEAPPAVQSAIERDFPHATVTYVGQHEVAGEPHYHVELKTKDGKSVYRTYSPTGQDIGEPH